MTRKKNVKLYDYIVKDKDREMMLGGVITDIYKDMSVQEGGFTIEYKKDGKTYAFALGYTELGAWVEYHKLVSER